VAIPHVHNLLRAPSEAQLDYIFFLMIDCLTSTW
jgi:hypothetical protein